MGNEEYKVINLKIKNLEEEVDDLKTETKNINKIFQKFIEKRMKDITTIKWATASIILTIIISLFGSMFGTFYYLGNKDMVLQKYISTSDTELLKNIQEVKDYIHKVELDNAKNE